MLRIKITMGGAGFRENKSLTVTNFLSMVLLFLIPLNIQAQNGQWKLVANLPTTRGAMMSVCEVGDKIFFIGGSTGAPSFSDLAANEAYDPLTNTWDIKSSMPTPRGFLATAAVNDTIYAIGGGFPSTPKTAVEAYDPHTNRWTIKAALPFPKSEIQAAAVGGKIYVMRGASDSRNGLKYDPSINKWEEIDVPLELPRVTSMAVYKNFIYVFSGTASPNGPSSKSLYVFDPGSGSWDKKKICPRQDSLSRLFYVTGKFMRWEELQK